MRQIDKVGSIILEPVGRNTAPSLALAALLSDKDDLLLVLAADHVIENSEAFVNAVQEAISLAEAGKFVTFGYNTRKALYRIWVYKKGANNWSRFWHMFNKVKSIKLQEDP